MKAFWAFVFGAFLFMLVLAAGLEWYGSPASSPPSHRYSVTQLTAPGGPTGYVYCAIVITDAGAVTTLFCEPTSGPAIPTPTPAPPPATDPRLSR
jgi:hypothetical protein